MAKVALVTGATAGIGASFARLFASEGFDLVLVARDEARVRETAENLKNEFGVNSEIVRADLTNIKELAAVEARVASETNPINVLVNNAGFGIKASFLTSDIAEEADLLDVLVRAPMRLMHAVLPVMKARNEGAIINVSSVATWITSGTYSASKSYLTVLSESLHTELRNTNVKVMALCPGFTRTEFHQRGNMHMTGLPNFLWLNADRVVAKAWRDVQSGSALSIPGWQYGILSTFARFGPRPIVRKLGINVRMKQRTK